MANRIRIAHPGRYGDLFWALPTVRALAERHGGPVDILLPTDPANTTPMQPLVPVLEAQEYIARAIVVPEWSITQDAPRAPRTPPSGLYGCDVHYALGYESWPTRALPYETAMLGGCLAQAEQNDATYFRPWIQLPPAKTARGRWPYPTIAVSWTDRYFELKLGILAEIRRLLPGIHVQWFAQPGSRMCEAGAAQADIWDLMHYLWMADVVLTDCSMAHVLAAGLGVRRVLVVEPEEARHHWVFWPGSRVVEDGAGGKRWEQRDTALGRCIRPVLGGDRRPTFDSRHTIHEITLALEKR